LKRPFSCQAPFEAASVGGPLETGSAPFEPVANLLCVAQRLLDIFIRIQSRYDQRDADRNARIEQQAQGYRRAMSACLEGRGYTVQ